MTNYIDNLKELSESELHAEIGAKIRPTVSEILDDDGIAGEIASSNADGWEVDDLEFDVSKVAFSDGQARVPLSFSLCGDQKEDRPFSGTTIKGTAVVVIDSIGQVSYTDVKGDRDMSLD